MEKNVISVIDGAAGSCGKAKVIGEIATDETINLGAAVTNCMPNAGHTFVDEEGNATVFQNIPVSIVNPNTDLFIGPGSAIDMNYFIEEYKRAEKYLGDRKIYVHEMVPLIEQRHIEEEKRKIKTGSTHKGCGAVSMEKIIRDPSLNFFKTYKNAVVCPYDEWLDRLYSHLDKSGEFTLLEGSQGCDLAINHSGNYPYVTSRNVSTAQLLADSGIATDRLFGTIMVTRPFPIRINNITKNGEYNYTGDMGSGEELTWTQINIASQEGQLPFNGDIESGCYAYNFDYDLEKSMRYVKSLYEKLPEHFKMQLFKEKFENPNLDDISIVMALEIERLYHKSHSEFYYESKILKTSDEDGYFIEDQSEQTTVTKRERRIFWNDMDKLKNNIRVNNPYGIYLNFFQHLSSEYAGECGDFDDYEFDMMTIERYLDWFESETGVEILALGTGDKNNERILKKDFLLR